MERKSSHYNAPANIRKDKTILQMYLYYTTARDKSDKTKGPQTVFNPITELPLDQLSYERVQNFLVRRLQGGTITTTQLMAEFYRYSLASPLLFITLVLADHASKSVLTSVAARETTQKQRENGPEAIRHEAHKSLALMSQDDRKLLQDLKNALRKDSPSLGALFEPLFMAQQKFAVAYKQLIEQGQLLYEENRTDEVVAVSRNRSRKPPSQPAPTTATTAVPLVSLPTCKTGQATGVSDRALTITAFYHTLREQARAGNETLYMRIVARIDWIRRHRTASAELTSPVLRSLPYMVPYEPAYTSLFKLLCVVQNQSRHFLEALVENDDTLEQAYARLPCFPYQRLAQMGRTEESRALYLYVYCYDVLRPQLFRAFWSHTLTLMSGVPPPLPSQGRTQLSCSDAEYLYNAMRLHNKQRLAQPECLYTPQFEQILRELFETRFLVREGISTPSVRRIPPAIDDATVSLHALDNYLLHQHEHSVVIDHTLIATEPERVREILGNFLRRPSHTPQYATSATTLCEMMINDNGDKQQQQERAFYHPVDTAMRACVAYCRDESSPSGMRTDGTVLSLFETSYTVSVGDLLHAYSDLASLAGASDGRTQQSTHVRQSRLQELLAMLSFDGRTGTKEARLRQLERMRAVVGTPHASYHTTCQIHAFDPTELQDSMTKHGVQTLGQARSFIRERYRPLRRVPVDSDGLQQCSHVASCLIVVRTTTLDGGTELFVDVSGDPSADSGNNNSAVGLYDELMLGDPQSQITICVTLSTYKYRLLEWRDETSLWRDDALDDAPSRPTLQLWLEERLVDPSGRVLRVDAQRATTLYWSPPAISAQRPLPPSRMLDRDVMFRIMGVQKDERTRVSTAYDTEAAQLRLCVVQDREADMADDDDDTEEGVAIDEEAAFFFIGTLLHDYRLYRDTLRLAGKTRYEQGQAIRSMFAQYRTRDFAANVAQLPTTLRIFYADNNGDYEPDRPEYTLAAVSVSLMGNELRLDSTAGSIILSSEQLIRNTERYISRDPRTRIPLVYQYMVDAVAAAQGESPLL